MELGGLGRELGAHAAGDAEGGRRRRGLPALPRRPRQLVAAAGLGMLLLAAGLGLAGCGSEQGYGLPHFLKFENRTPGAITILHQRPGGPEVVVVPTLAAGALWGDYINTHGNMGDLCKGGDYIARDESGDLVARHDDMSCRSWVVATEPIPISITNSTDLPLSVDVSTRDVSGPTSVIRVVTDLKPQATFSGSLGDLGDPNDLCLGEGPDGHGRRRPHGCNDRPV